MSKNEHAKLIYRTAIKLLELHGEGQNISRKDNNEIFEIGWNLKQIAIRIRCGYNFDADHPYWRAK